MNRNDCKDKEHIEYLDKVNNERLDNTRMRVAHAIRILKPVAWSKYKNDEQKSKLKTDIAYAVNLLDIATEEMEFHCEWFDYDTGVIFTINDACNMLGYAMAEMFEDEYDIDMVVADVKDACVFLAKSLASLIRWDEDDTSNNDA